MNWKNGKAEQELFAFVKGLIALRKNYPVLSPAKESMGLDLAGCGVPDVSYHGELAWRAPSEVSSRQLGVYYCAVTLGGADCFVAYNMHWLSHEFALPAMSGKRKWYLKASTKEGILEEEVLLECQRQIKVEPRTILFIVGR